MALDFTFDKYKELLTCISNSNYPVIKVRDILRGKAPEKYIIIRHDVDLDAQQQLPFSKLEKNFNIFTSYYFRVIKNIYDNDVMRIIKNQGHEIGYHYETLSKTEGNLDEAFKLFTKELKLFSHFHNKITICPHGGFTIPGKNGYTMGGILKLIKKAIKGEKFLSEWKSSSIWSKNKIDSLSQKILGDAHNSVDFSDILYLSDTGRSWNNKYKNIDLVESQININVNSTDQIMSIIESNKFSKIYILVHFEQWKSSFKDWQIWYFSQLLRRNAKLFVKNLKT